MRSRVKVALGNDRATCMDGSLQVTVESSHGCVNPEPQILDCYLHPTTLNELGISRRRILLSGVPC